MEKKKKRKQFGFPLWNSSGLGKRGEWKKNPSKMPPSPLTRKALFGTSVWVWERKKRSESVSSVLLVLTRPASVSQKKLFFFAYFFAKAGVARPTFFSFFSPAINRQSKGNFCRCVGGLKGGGKREKKLFSSLLFFYLGKACVFAWVSHAKTEQVRSQPLLPLREVWRNKNLARTRISPRRKEKKERIILIFRSLSLLTGLEEKKVFLRRTCQGPAKKKKFL